MLKKNLATLLITGVFFLPDSAHSHAPMGVVPPVILFNGPGFSTGIDFNSDSGTQTGFAGISYSYGFYSVVSMRIIGEGLYSFTDSHTYINAVAGIGVLGLLLDFGASYVPAENKAGGLIGGSLELPSGNRHNLYMPRLYVHWNIFNSHRVENSVRTGISLYFSLPRL